MKRFAIKWFANSRNTYSLRGLQKRASFLLQNRQTNRPRKEREIEDNIADPGPFLNGQDLICQVNACSLN